MHGIKDNVLKSIKKIAEKHNIQKIILFGSRARGDYKERSDIDLAVSGGNVAAFSLDVEEETPTLLMFDVVDMDGTVQQELLASIHREGIIIYEKV